MSKITCAAAAKKRYALLKTSAPQEDTDALCQGLIYRIVDKLGKQQIEATKVLPRDSTYDDFCEALFEDAQDGAWGAFDYNSTGKIIFVAWVPTEGLNGHRRMALKELYGGATQSFKSELGGGSVSGANFAAEVQAASKGDLAEGAVSSLLG